MKFKRAKVGGPPVFWNRVKVIDKSTGEPMKGVVEANAVEGWVERYALDSEGRIQRAGDEGLREVVNIQIEIVPDLDLNHDGALDQPHPDDIEADVLLTPAILPPVSRPDASGDEAS